MPPRLYLDLSRLLFAAFNRTPVGIPRIELAYAEYLISHFPERLQFVILDSVGRLRILGHRRATDFVNAIARYWHADVERNQTYVSIVLRNALLHTELLFTRRAGFAESIQSHDGPSVYIISSQLHMERAGSIERLKAGGKLRVAYFVHDIIPTTFPEYFPPDAEERCRRRMQAAARLADIIIASSNDTANAFLQNFARERAPASIVVAPPGLSIPLASSPAEIPASSPYFVMVGTIEPRKNHLLILNLWRALRAERVEPMPRLVLIGSRGWENENIVDMLERSPALAGVVEERGRVSDQEMTKLLLGASALLLPSFAEGYGLPLAEALALGVPVLCSDIPVFREVGGEMPEFIDPLDGPGWRRAILDYLPADSIRRQAQLKRLRTWRPPTWQSHFDKVMGAIDGIGERQGSM